MKKILFAVFLCGLLMTGSAWAKTGSPAGKSLSFPELCEKGSIEQVEAALKEKKTTPEELIEGLYNAIEEEQNSRIVELILDSGVDPNGYCEVERQRTDVVTGEKVSSKVKHCPFFSACTKRDWSYVDTFLKHGADPNLELSQVYAGSYFFNCESTPFLVIAWTEATQHDDAIVARLIDAGANINKVVGPYKMTAFATALQYCRTNVICTFLAAGADVAQVIDGTPVTLFLTTNRHVPDGEKIALLQQITLMQILAQLKK